MTTRADGVSPERRDDSSRMPGAYEPPAIIWELRLEMSRIGASFTFCVTDSDCVGEPKAPCI